MLKCAISLRLGAQVTDAANEAKDNVKYLATLEKSLEPLFHGTVQDITETVPALMSNIRMMYTIARYYSTPEHMTRLFTKLTNQMIRKCKDQITFDGKLWDQVRLRAAFAIGGPTHVFSWRANARQRADAPRSLRRCCAPSLLLVPAKR